MHVTFIPYSSMKVDPASWMKMITKYKGELSQPFVRMTFASFSRSQQHNNYCIICITFVLPAYIDRTDFKHPIRQTKSFVINLE